MISTMKAITLPLILAMGSNAINSCLDGEIAATMVGERVVDLSGCGLVDADHDDISTFRRVHRSEPYFPEARGEPP